MGDLVNLNKARKAKAKVAARAQAAENTVKFGLTKAEREAEAARAEKAKRDLDGHERE
ncbi:DUF4169 family protein [Rhodobacter ferrooxidans]|uniref:Uncharacterized protein n=1 Tax=Rhodobacter ferrooxidans TaxID=371731 RepID=C8S4U2_9RHOB|nr:DUF4169 family protein [Rhodobacter sp. SW2]EEW24001.1 conserved hypothetical protein [Rhodobacter sp. SW2]